MSGLPRAFTASALLLLGACDPESTPEEFESGEPLDLVDPDQWIETPAELDPLAQHRPNVAICPASGYGLEFGVLEVDTGQCNYLSVSQPLGHAIAAGDRLRVTVWWQTLIAGEPAMGHLALLVDDELLWETHVAIPGEADVRQIEFESPLAANGGEVLTFHLHNHGYNSWTFGGLELLDETTK